MKTYSPKPQDIERRWYVIDANGAVLGRLASEVAAILRGKHKPMFAPHMDTGDHVIVVNAKGVRLTGGKEDKKIAYRHSGYPGGLTETKYGRLMGERPAWAVEKAVKGMLPHNSLGREMAAKLHVYDGPEHRQESQKPLTLNLGQIPKWEGLPEPKPRRTSADRSEVATGATGPKPKATAKRAASKPPAKPGSKAAAAKATAKTTAKRSAAKPAGERSAAKRSTSKRKDD